MRSLALTIVLAAALVLSTNGCSKKGSKNADKADSAAAAAAAAGAVVVKVNGKNITAQDVARQENVLVQQVQSYADSAQIAAMMPSIKKQAVDNAINRVLLEETIKKLDIKALKEQVDSRLEYYRKNFVSEEAFQADLTKRGITLEEMRREIETGMQAEELFSRRTANIKPVNDQDVRSFYDNNEQRFRQPERVRASHILLTVNKDDADAVRAQKKKDAERILGELKKGADFAEMARQHSGCPSKDQGGDLGYFERGRMVPAFENAAFGLKTGQVSGVVETEFGYHIIKVTDHAKESAVPFEQAKQNISQYLTEQKKQEAITAYFDSLRTASKIQYVDTTFAR